MHAFQDLAISAELNCYEASSLLQSLASYNAASQRQELERYCEVVQYIVGMGGIDQTSSS